MNGKKYAIKFDISPEDVDRVMQYKWYGYNNHGKIYARTNINGKLVFMHRFVLGIEDKRQVDHIDGNPLNNTRENLRVSTQQENCRNRRVSCRNKTGLKGVSPYRGRYKATIYYEKKHIHLGLFETPQEAHETYLEASKTLFGAFHPNEHLQSVNF